MSKLREASRGVVTYLVAVSLSLAWPTLMLSKVLPVLAYPAGSAAWRGFLDTYGAPLVGTVASLALGDFIARRHPGRTAPLHGGIAFGLVFVLSLGLSLLWSTSFAHVYDLVLPPHVLVTLAGAWLGQQGRFHRLSLYAGLLCWPLAGLVALYYLASVLGITWFPSHIPLPLYLFCLGIFGVAVARTVMTVRKLLGSR
ncbi:MAG TPA: hypothetical protein VK539_11275 [Myxococcaceae bacterium]|nr:hypothetical protein [Myxococcaceae bacterium]